MKIGISLSKSQLKLQFKMWLKYWYLFMWCIISESSCIFSISKTSDSQKCVQQCCRLKLDGISNMMILLFKVSYTSCFAPTMFLFIQVFRPSRFWTLRSFQGRISRRLISLQRLSVKENFFQDFHLSRFLSLKDSFKERKFFLAIF